MLSGSGLWRLDFKLLLVVCIISILPAYALSTLGLFEDLEIYYSLFCNIVDVGIVDAVSQFILQTGKYEPFLFLIFFTQSIFIPKSVFWFLLVNFSLLSYGFSKITGFFIKESEKITIFFTIVAILSYSFFSREIYIIRSMYAFLFLMLFIREEQMLGRGVIFMFGIFTHASFILFSGVYLIIEYGYFRFKRNGFVLYSIAIALMAQALIFYAPFISSFTSSGEITVFTASNDANVFQSIGVVFFTFLSLIYSIRNSGSDKEKLLLLLCIYLTGISLLNFSSYQLMNRIAAPALCIAPFLLMKRGGSNVQLAIKFVYIISTLATFRLIYLFQSGSFVLAG